MSKSKARIEKLVSSAVKHFWTVRTSQDRKQGTRTGRRDHGNRAAATGGKQLDGFNGLICSLLLESGLPEETVFQGGRSDVTLPGYFRPSKQWDVVVVAEGHLLAVIECKALCGPSFGNNYNNRVEEALGSATDIWTAYREGAFGDSPRPFVGYVLLLEEADASTKPVAVLERHFPVFDEFRDVSYAQRCQETVRKLARERCYDAGCLILSSQSTGIRGTYREPADDLAFSRFSRLMCTQVAGLYEVVTD